MAADTIAMSPVGGSGNRGGGFGGAGGHARGGSGGGEEGHRDGMKSTDHQSVFEQFRNKVNLRWGVNDGRWGFTGGL